MTERIVVFLCRCADNIAGAVDLAALEERSRALPEVTIVATHDLLCSPDGKQFVTATLRQQQATRAVVAACSIRDHETTFQRCLTEAGLNRHLLAMTNIREHCAWVTPDRDQATAKAGAAIAATLARVRLLAPLADQSIEVCPDLVVIGGGVAGVEAALLAAGADRKVTMVERGPALGGYAARVEDASPLLECTPCMLAPRLTAVLESPGIDLATCAEVTDVVGYLGSFRVTVAQRARWVRADHCIGCDECMKVCPVEVDNEFDHGLSRRKAVYLPYPGAMPNVAVIDRDHCLRAGGQDCTACRDACPMEAIDYDQPDTSREVPAGAIVMATGFVPHRPAALAAIGHDRRPDILTSPEFERLLASDGPTSGQPRRADGESPRRIAVLHCFGRGELGYCSGVCCSGALKYSLLVNRHGGETEVVHLFSELVLPGPNDQALADRAVAKGGARLIRVSDPAAITVDEAEGGGYRLRLPPGSEQDQVTADMIVALTGFAADPSNAGLADRLGLRRAASGFLEPDHFYLRGLQTSVEGVEMAGCVAGPKNMAGSIAQGQGATGVVLSRLQPGRELALETTTAEIDDDRCSRCLVCVAVCPYRANEVDPETGRPATNPVLCKGCGTCVAACPTGAAASRHFSDHQLLAEIRELLHD